MTGVVEGNPGMGDRSTHIGVPTQQARKILLDAYADDYNRKHPHLLGVHCSQSALLRDAEPGLAVMEERHYALPLEGVHSPFLAEDLVCVGGPKEIAGVREPTVDMEVDISEITEHSQVRVEQPREDGFQKIYKEGNISQNDNEELCLDLVQMYPLF